MLTIFYLLCGCSRFRERPLIMVRGRSPAHKCPLKTLSHFRDWSFCADALSLGSLTTLSEIVLLKDLACEPST